MINHNFDEFTTYFCADINDVIITFLTFGNHQPKNISMQPTSILRLNHVFFLKIDLTNVLTRSSVNLTNSLSEIISERQL